ncbi:MAG: class I SAM-dependent methyltransferase [Rhodospirillales bacterium]|nr:class I SAM-dependent methyltransferase [Rhodospirillales bacterium]
MTEKLENFDDTWDALYGTGGRHNNRYPFNSVVQFLFSHSPKDVPRDQLLVLEVGCGAGNNLWFAAREGFRVAGIDASKAAIKLATARFREDGLEGDIRVGDATRLPFDDASVDLVIDRAAMTHMPKDAIGEAISEVRRVLKPGGKFHFNPFGDRCSSAQRDAHNSTDTGGTLTGITGGCLVGSGMASVYSRIDVEELFRDGWNLFNLMRVDYTEMNEPRFMIHEEWLALVEKTIDLT